MVFSDSSTYQGLIQDIDFLLFGSSAVFNTDYPLADRVRNINIVWDEAIAELYKADPNHKWDDTTNTDLPFATLPLTANLDHYTLLDSALVIHRVRMMSKGGELKTLQAVVRSELTDSELNATGEPEKYYKIGGVVFPVPIPDYGASSGVELEFQRGANHFTAADTTKSPGFASQFHQFLSVGAALRYAISNGMKNKVAQLRADKENIRTAMREHYERRSPDERPRMRLKRDTSHYGL
jgi:hypothetical protein